MLYKIPYFSNIKFTIFPIYSSDKYLKNYSLAVSDLKLLHIILRTSVCCIISFGAETKDNIFLFCNISNV